MHQYDLAIEYLTLAAHLEKDKNAETYSDLARCIYKRGDKEMNRTNGMEMVKKALKINEKCANAWLNKGNIHEDMDQVDEAQKCYEEAKRLKPRLAGAFTNLGNLKYQAGQNEDACLDYLTALDIDCDDSETLANLGMALAQTKYREFASIAFEEALAAGYGNLDILNNYLYFLLED